MLGPLKQKLIFVGLIGLFFVWHLRTIGPQNTYALDSFVKLVQTVSIQNNQFLSEELIYNAKQLDTKSLLHPLPTFTIEVNGKMLSPFSVDFAALNALLLNFIDKRNLPYVCLLFSFLTVLVFLISKQISFPTLILACLGTPLIYQGLEFSENSILLFFQALGFFFYFKNSTALYKFLSGFFLSSGIFFRLENIVFVILFYFFIFLYVYKFNIFEFIKSESIRLTGCILPLCLFVLQNLYLYGHILGARFLSNQGSLSNFEILGRLEQARNLIFLTYFKIGFFGFTPIFLISIGYFYLEEIALKVTRTRCFCIL